jgi:hypothetical protein
MANAQAISAPEIVVLSGTHAVGTFGWRHALTWRQLSILWRLPVSYRLTDSALSSTEGVGVYSIPITSREDQELSSLAHYYHTPAVVAVFLDRARLSVCGVTGALTVRPQEPYRPQNPFQYILRVAQRHPLVEGLPEQVVIRGQGPPVTPVQVEDGMQVLVSLDEVPIITYRRPHLFVGADPWQLGVPSVPMLYKILSNWLIHETGYRHRMLKPYAVVRLDDLPTTAEELKRHFASSHTDWKRSRIIRRLRRFARHTATKLTLMYSSHFRRQDGNLASIASIMPRSIREMALGVKQGVFEIGSHGMIHLRDPATAQSSLDPGEFLDLDEQDTALHLDTCAEEIVQLFGVRPHTFVAPAWRYRPGVTKKVAARRYAAIVDSTQHVASGECDVLLTLGDNGSYVNVTETFRPGSRMLAYGNPAFWQCYAAAGIPIHYLQHTDTNWHLLRGFLRGQLHPVSQPSQGKFMSRLLEQIENPRRSLYLRGFCTALLVMVHCTRETASWAWLWDSFSRSSLYTFVRAMQMAGYTCIGLTEFMTIAKDFVGSPGE